jgi:hypothetical protein
MIQSLDLELLAVFMFSVGPKPDQIKTWICEDICTKFQFNLIPPAVTKRAKLTIAHHDGILTSAIVTTKSSFPVLSVSI